MPWGGGGAVAGRTSWQRRVDAVRGVLWALHGRVGGGWESPGGESPSFAAPKEAGVRACAGCHASCAAMCVETQNKTTLAAGGPAERPARLRRVVQTTAGNQKGCQWRARLGARTRLGWDVRYGVLNRWRWRGDQVVSVANTTPPTTGGR